MKKIIKCLTSILFISALMNTVFAQEVLKSIEEDYYDFLSLNGITERPTLGYRTLSDNVWLFNEVESFEENEDGTFTKVHIPGKECDGNVWKNNNLGTSWTLWQPSNPASNWFTRGIKQGLTVRVYGPEWFNSYNSSIPYGQNDGGLWQGAGYNTALTAGLRIEGYGFELTFKPQLSWSQNKAFDINSNIYPNPYSYSFNSGTVNTPIDLVQRYGDSSFFNYDWGDSEIRWSWHSFTMGFGTQNPWLGPAYLNPMLGSNNAGGYLKFDIGLRKTKIIIPHFGWDLGYIEGRIWIGQLNESSYFDNNPANDKRMVTGLSASYKPSFIPGFTIGLNRIFMNSWNPENIKYIFRLFTLSGSNGYLTGNDEDQKFSLFAEWNFSKIGFTVYGEYGCDDFSSDFTTNPFHTAIYTIGLKKTIPIKLKNAEDLQSELIFEWNNFEMSQDFQLQWQYLGFYAHGALTQGYTQNGQILGAGYCWAGNSQLLQYKVYYKKGFTSLKILRYCPNNNSVLSQAVNTASDATTGSVYTNWYANYETYYSFGLESLYYITNNFSLNGEINYVCVCNRNYNNNLKAHNLNLTLLLKFVF